MWRTDDVDDGESGIDRVREEKSQRKKRKIEDEYSTRLFFSHIVAHNEGENALIERKRRKVDTANENGSRRRRRKWPKFNCESKAETLF